ncbi:universal stress protein [Pseudomonas sp. BJa5]|uniref:universal stress protein n=1 Tax=Pseudomonas sp. BJa5 TaxID=2936270 RepID=UPI0025597643|nr:universal stress protein [Pseudomonas sp. BGr12]MDL2420982.1 universal stress protein [Pseudomonas sp. BGr12]
MSQYQQLLLLAQDAELTSPAARRATALARATGAGLHVLGLFEPHGLGHWQQEKDTDRHIAEQFGQFRDRLLEQVGAIGLDNTCASGQAVVCDDPLKDVLACLGERRPDMVISDLHKVSPLARAFGTPFDKQLMQASQVPVHVVPDGAAALPKVILAAIDTSLPEQGADFNQRIIRQAMAMALQCDARLHLLCAYDISPLFVADSNAASDWVEELVAALREPYDALADLYGVAPECRHFVQGAPVAVIREQVLDLAVDVVVMGIVQPKGLGKLLGDTTERIVNSALCSVLAVNRTP